MDTSHFPEDPYAPADWALRVCVADAMGRMGWHDAYEALSNAERIKDRTSAQEGLAVAVAVLGRIPDAPQHSREDLVRGSLLLALICVGFACDGYFYRSADTAREVAERLTTIGIEVPSPGW
jgi:hypothetical protein